MKPERWHEVDKILQSVLERDPAERDAYLDQVCAGDEQLRHAVLTVMASYKDDGTFMASPVLEVSGDDFAGAKLKPGDSIGPYRIMERIGRGGMGEVYLAEHTTLRREVALKILPEHFLDDAQRVQRFRQEARAVLALNHPNVVTVYDIGEAAGIHFISTEFVEGQTLRERMKHARLTVSEAIEIAAQVAAAIAYAHEKGVIHRDVKPENIMLRPDGYLKVLDFGIAKLTERQTATTDPNEAQTRMKVETSPGMVMGTCQYMSPEQARGLAVDERTDTWSLGCVLYEMLTGRQPFEGETASDVIATILKHDPTPLAAFVADAPPELANVASKALDKSKDERYQTAKDFLADLRRFKRRYEHEAEIERSMSPGEGTHVAAQLSTGGRQANATGTGQTGPAAPAPTTSSAEYIVSEFKRHRTGILIGVASFILIVGAGGFLLFKYLNRNLAGRASTQALKITPLPINGVLTNTYRNEPAISPDGKYVVYVFRTYGEKGEEEYSMWEMYRPTGDSKQILPPSAKHSYGGLSFAADGDYVYYWDFSVERLQVSLYKISLIGGAPKKLIDNIKTAYFAPSPDGKQVAFLRDEANGSGSLVVANEDGTGERLLTTRDSVREHLEGAPAWSPDGKSIVCLVAHFGADPHRSPLIVNVADGTQKEVTTARWFWSLSVVWLNDGSGLLVGAREFRTAPLQVWAVSYPEGATRKVTNDLNDYSFASATADSKTLLAVQEKRSSDVCVTPLGGDATGQPYKQVTFTKSDGQRGVAWTPDGKIVFTSMAGGVRDVWVMNADGSDRRQITSGGGDKYSPAVSPDGRFVVFVSGDYHLWRVDLDGSNLKQLTFSVNEEQFPRFTPDGKWITFNSFRTGKLTPWKVPANGGESIQLSDRQMACETVSPDGKLLGCLDDFGVEGKAKIILLPIEGGEPAKVIEIPIEFKGELDWTTDGSAFTLHRLQGGIDNIWKLPLDGGQPRPLTNFNDTSLVGIYSYALSKDGKRLAFARANVTRELVLITDFK